MGKLKVKDSAAITSMNNLLSALSSLSHTQLADIGTNTHATIDTHLSSYHVSKVAYVADRKNYGVDGGTFTSGDWRVRDLNWEYDPYNIVVVSSNSFTLGSGKFMVWGSAPAYRVNRHQTKIFRTSGSVSYLCGSSEESSSVSGTNRSFFSYLIDGGYTYQIQHRCQTTYSTYGYGCACNWGSGNYEFYTMATIIKLE